MTNILNYIFGTFCVSGLVNVLFATLFGALAGAYGLVIRKFKILSAILLCLFSAAICNARQKEFDKNTKAIDSKEIEISTRQYDCQVSFTILIDRETSRQDIYLQFVFFAKKASVIDVNGNLLLGCKGDPRYEYEPHHFRRGRTENYICLKVWYPLEDINGFFDCNKARLQTVTGNIDLEFSRSQVKELQRYYDKAVSEATTIYKTNTDITYGF